jgi:two-component system chemotaxis response regulator CheB
MMSGEQADSNEEDATGGGEGLGEAALRVLVVDDSAYNRQTISAMLEGNDGVEVVGRATNGKEALKLVFDLDPDVITLDLEMPEMDGFAFLRLLMSRRPTPVLVISGYSQRENVFRALELGALDFIAKPRRGISPDIRNIETALVQKIAMVRRLQAVRLKQRAESLAAQGRTGARGDSRSSRADSDEPSPLEGKAARVAVGIGSSTGGPPAIQQLLCAIPVGFQAAIVIAQHMPPRFTKAFAERLDRLLDIRVVEAADGQPLLEGVVYVVPGGHNVNVDADGQGGHATLQVVESTNKAVPKLAPSADHLFETMSAAYGSRFCATILTGMGSDGTAGARIARERGGRIFAEDPETAVMPGMPHSAVEAGIVEKTLPLERLHELLLEFVGQSR